ncbi:MAG: ABC transporter substrate-binding protein [Bacillota bacterium]
MRLKRRVMFILSILLILPLAACGGTKTGGGDAAEETIEEVEPSVVTADETKEESVTAEEPSGETAAAENPNATPEMDFDLGGRTIKVVSWWDMTLSGEDPDTLQRIENLEKLKKKHNFNIEYIAIDYGEYRDKIVASLSAGQPLGDIVRVGKAYAIPALVKRDMFWPVDEYTKNDKVFNQTVREFSKYEGRSYGFSENLQNMATGIFYNKTLEKKLGLKPLQEYMNENTWNWETFITVAKSANRDTDNDGKLDTWGLASGGFLEQALAANETDLVNEEMKKHNLDDPRVIETFNFISRLATENVPRPTEGGDWTEPRQFFVQGNTLMYAGCDYETSGLQNDMADYEIGFLPFPKGPSASTYHGCEPLAQFLTIPKTVDNPEQLLYIWEKIFDIESVYEYPGQGWYENLFDNEDDINNLVTAAAGMRLTNQASFPDFPFWNILGDLRNGVSVSTVIETYKADCQAKIDAVYNN